MAAKKIEIIYDINGKAIDVAVQSTLNLQQQVKALTAELRKTKEGTDEFALLSKRLNNTHDDLTRVNTKSRELFSTFSLIPGPIGDIFGKLNGVIGLLKTFSGFSIKDLNNQLKVFNDDLNGVVNGFLGVKKVTDETNDSLNQNTSNVNDNSSAQQDRNDALDDGTTATNAGTAANNEQTKSIKKQAEAAEAAEIQYNNFSDTLNTLSRAGYEYEIQSKQMANGIEITGAKITDLDGVTKEYTIEQLGAVNATQDLTANIEYENDGFKQLDAAIATNIAVTKELTFWQEAAAFATNALNVALKAIGIGIIIGAVVTLVSVLKDLVVEFYDWATGVTAAKTAMDEVNKTIATTNELLDLDLKGVKRRNEEYIALLKSKGATDKEINKATIDGLKERLSLTETALNDITAAENKALKEGRATGEEYLKIEANRTKLEQETKDIRSQIRVKELDGITENNKKILESKQKSIEEAKKLREKELSDNKTADEALLKLLDENAALRQTDKRKKEDEELKTAMEAEERTINMLKISEEKKGIIINQIKVKYGLKVLEINDKRNEEDLKSQQEHNDKVLEWDKKLAEMSIQSIGDQAEQEKAEKRKKYNDDIAELDKAYKDKLVTQDQYNQAVKDLDQALANDLKKIQDDKEAREKDAKLKKLDDDIKFLQIQTDAEKNSFTAYWDDRKKLLEKAEDRELLETDATGEKKHQIEKKYTQLYKDLQKEKLDAYLGFATAILGATGNLFSQQQTINGLAMQNELDKVKGNAEEEDKIKEKYFYRNRDAQKGQAIISTLQSAISAYSSLAVIPIVGPVLGAAAAAAALIFGYKQVDLIAGQTYQSSTTGGSGASSAKPPMPNYGKNYGDGGMIEGPRHSSPQGGVPVMAEGGEAVMSRGAVTMFRPLLSMMNQAGGGTSFTKGAMGQANFDNPKSAISNQTTPQIIKSYVVSSELTSEQQKQARLKNLSIL